MRLLNLIALLFCGLSSAAHAQGQIVQNTPPYTGTALGSGYTSAPGGILFAPYISAYNLSLPFSTSMWVKIPSTAGASKFFLNATNQAFTNGFGVAQLSSDSADSELLQSFLQASPTNCNGAGRLCANSALINDGQLHHLCTTWTKAGSAFYIDSVQWAWGPSGAAYTPDTTFPWIIGSGNPAGSIQIDVAAWSRALTPAECATIYNRGVAGFSLLSGNAPASLNNQLVAYWSLSNCTGTLPSISCPDASTNNNPATTDPPPTVVVTNPTDGETGITGSIALTATCTDTYGVTSVAFSIDGNAAGTDTASPYSVSFNTLLLDDVRNPHTATAVCTNIGGNTATASNTFSTNNGTIAPTTYYLSVLGSDSNNGLSLGAPWLTPNHAIRCGDTILAASSQSYVDANFYAGKWGTVWSCPTAVDTTGIYYAFLKCAGSFVEDCFINTSNQGLNAMRVSAANWAIKGWTATSTQSATSCFGTNTTTISPGVFTSPPYILFVNDYAKQCTGSGFGGLGDYDAVVGSLAYGNSYNGSSCFQGISIGFLPASSNPSDTNTHIFVGGTFSINNQNQQGCTDGNGTILDDMFLYTNQIVLEQNLVVGNGSNGFESNGGNATINFPIYITHSTYWGNGLAQGSGRISEIEFSDSFAGFGASGLKGDSIIAVAIGGPNVCKFNRTAPYTCPPGFAPDYAINITSGPLYPAPGSCPSGTCTLSNSYIWDASGNNLFIADPGNALIQTNNTFANPGLTSPIKPSGPPDCSASATVLACVAAIRANFVPSGGAAALGYQPPGACAPDPLYPVWLKGSVPDGLLTKPCGY